MLLRPFVISLESLSGSPPPKLRLDASPGFICRESSEAIVSLTSTYQSRFSLRNPPPLLPYMVFTAVLYQLSLIADLQRLQEPAAVDTTPVKQCDFPYHQDCGPFRSMPFSTPTSIRPMPHPQSPTLTTQAGRVARHRSSALSTVSPCPSITDHKRRPSISGFSSVMESDGDEVSSDNNSDVLPTFTSDPVDLITIGTLQLVSMGSQHCGAAVTAQVLQTIGNLQDLRGIGIESLAARLQSFPMDEFTTATLMAGFGLQGNQPTTVVNDLTCVPGFDAQGFASREAESQPISAGQF